tara:strand:+ start:8065 stop:8865 length:801 start_codon:yes stop_codon:yes gene_type:complete
MNYTRIHLTLITCLLAFASVIAQKPGQQAQLEFDHLVIFTPSKQLELELTKSLFTLAEKAGSIHKEQGTEGQYIFFYNTFIELLYLKDSSQILANEPRFGSAYSRRWKLTKNICPMGFGLNLLPFDTSSTEFKFKVYQSSDAADNEYYLMSKYNSKQAHPLVYLSMPNHAYIPYNSLNDVDQRFDEYMRADQKSYLSHPSGIKRLTEIVLTIPSSAGSKGNMALLKELEQVKIEYGDAYGLTLSFDNQAQGKEITVPCDFNLIIKY